MPSRYDITLDTGTSTDANANENYFDQAMALSQGVINASFRQLFKQLEAQSEDGKCEAVYASPLKYRMDLVLDAPSIMINGSTSNATEVLYVLRIRSGTFTFPDGKTRDAQNWELAITTNLNEVTWEDSNKIWQRDIKRKYPGFVPGDYSVQRIFCALGSAKWQSPHPDYSWARDPKTQQKVKLETYLDSEYMNLYKTLILTVLGEWAKKEAEMDYSTLGIKFSLPEPKIDANKPTFRPVNIFTQVYPWLKDDKDLGGMGMGDYSDTSSDNKFGKLVDRDYNCLLYCENVDRSMGVDNKVMARPLPRNRKIGHNGNLAEPGIYGSFVMDHRVFMATFLLPQCQELCLATYLQVGRPERSYTASTRSGNIVPIYAIGRELKGNPPRSASDSFFKLERIKDSHHRWSTTSVKDGLNDIFPYSHPETPNLPFMYSNYKISSDSSVEVQWQTGGNTLAVKGRMFYDYYICFASSSDMKVDPDEKHYTIEGTWSIDIVFENQEQEVKVEDKTVKVKVMQPIVQGIHPTGEPKNTTLVTNVIKSSTTISSNTKETLEAELKETLSKGMMIIINNLKTRFATSGKFSYPGYGELEYLDPKFTRLGNLIATVNYKPPSGPGGTMAFPKIDKDKLVIKPPSIPVPETSTFESSLADDAEPHLKWAMEFDYNETTKIGRFSLKAQNTTDKDLAFGFIRVGFLHSPNKDGGAVTQNKLFSETDWKPDRDGIMSSIFKTGKGWIRKATQPSVNGSGGEDGAGESEKSKREGKDAEEKMEVSGNVYDFERGWAESKDLPDEIEYATSLVKTEVSVEEGTRTLEFSIYPTNDNGGSHTVPEGFIIPPTKTLKLVMQGEIAYMGTYAVKVHESWKRIASDMLKEGKYSVDWKMVRLAINAKGGVDTEAWDVSDRRKEGSKPKN